MYNSLDTAQVKILEVRVQDKEVNRLYMWLCSLHSIAKFLGSTGKQSEVPNLSHVQKATMYCTSFWYTVKKWQGRETAIPFTRSQLTLSPYFPPLPSLFNIVTNHTFHELKELPEKICQAIYLNISLTCVVANLSRYLNIAGCVMHVEHPDFFLQLLSSALYQNL